MIVFVSNYYNHHQAPFCNIMHELTKGEFRFIATEPMEAERINMGWGGDSADFVLEYYEDEAGCQGLIDEADAVLYGSAPYGLIENRLKNNKLTFFVSERPYKNKFPWYKFPIRFVRYYKWFGRYKSLYLLCSSAFSARDYAITGTFLNKAYKWGYFPELIKYRNIDEIIKQKETDSILWVARLIEWKHPEIPIRIAKMLKAEGYNFKLNMIGNGEMESSIKKMIADHELEDCVNLLGPMKPQEVRHYMEKSQIFLFTSDRNEGWGAVLNEAMNSGCAVVASHAIGAVPFLLENKHNGLVYKDNDFDFLYKSVKKLLDNEKKRQTLGENAYKTITEAWCAQVGAERLLVLINDLIKKEKTTQFTSGPCSKAPIIRNGWFKG